MSGVTVFTSSVITLRTNSIPRPPSDLRLQDRSYGSLWLLPRNVRDRNRSPRTARRSISASRNPLRSHLELLPAGHMTAVTCAPGVRTPRAPAKASGPTGGTHSEDLWLHIGGDFGPADTGASVVETLYLPPGNYAFACWQTGTQSGGENGPPHAAKGMVAQFTVT